MVPLAIYTYMHTLVCPYKNNSSSNSSYAYRHEVSLWACCSIWAER